MERIERDLTAPIIPVPNLAPDVDEHVQRINGTLEVTLHAASRLIRRRRADRNSANAEVARALTDRFGDANGSLFGNAEIEAIAARAVEIAQREIAIAAAAKDLADVSGSSMQEATVAVAGRFDDAHVLGPYDRSTPEGRTIHRRWLGVAAWEAKVRAEQDEGRTDEHI